MKTSTVQTSRVNRSPVHAAPKTSRSQKPLVSSSAEAKREATSLRRARENLESETTVDETDIRTSLP